MIPWGLRLCLQTRKDTHALNRGLACPCPESSLRSGREVGIWLYTLNEGCDQLRRVGNVLERDGLDGGVHVAQRNADQRGRHTAAGQLDRVGVGARAARG